MGVNGKVVDDRITGVRSLKASEYEPPLGPELGTPFDDDTIFGDFQDGKVFDYDRWSARDMAEMLDRDGQAKTVEQALTLPIRRTPWDIIPAEDGDASDAELIKKMLTTPANAGGMSVPMSHVIGQATSAFGYRKAFFEKVFRIAESGELEGKIVYDKIAWRPTSMCQLARTSRTGSFAGFRQRPRIFDQDDMRQLVDWIMIDPNKAWVYIHGQHRDPLRGYSDLEIPLWCYRTKQKLRFLWYTFLEGQAIPKALVRDADPGRAKTAASKLRYLKNSGVIALDNSTQVDPYESAGRGADQFIAAINFLDSEMSGSVLAGFLDLSSKAASGTGSYALSKDSSDFFLKSRQAVLEELEESINSYLIADLAKWNLGDKPAPRFKFGQLAEADVADALQLLTAMASSTANNLPAEFTYELAAKAAEYLDLDIDKLHASFEQHAKEKEEQAKAMADQMNNPAMAAAVQKGTIKPEVAKHMANRAGQVGRAAGAVNQATRVVQQAQAGAKLSEYGQNRMIIDLAGKILDRQSEERVVYFTAEGFESAPASVLYDDEDQPAELVRLEGGDGRDIELAAVDGHHVPGTAYHWRHEWRPLYASVALRYRKGKKLAEKLQSSGRIHPVEPDWYQGLKPGEKTTKKVGSGRGTKSDPIKIGLKPISGGDEGGTKLPFEGKGQTSKTAKKVISEAEKHFGKNGGPDGPTPAQKLNQAKRAQTAEAKAIELKKVEDKAYVKAKNDLNGGGPDALAKNKKALEVQSSELIIKAMQKGIKQAIGEHEHAMAAQQEQDLAKKVAAEKKAFASAKSLLADGTVDAQHIKEIIDGMPEDPQTPYLAGKKKGYKKALAAHLLQQAQKDELKAELDSSHQAMKKLLDAGPFDGVSFGQAQTMIETLEGSGDLTPKKKAKVEGFKKALSEAKAKSVKQTLSEETGIVFGDWQPPAEKKPAVKPPAAKTTAQAIGHPGWKTKNAAINNAKKKSADENVNYFAFQGDDGNWYITKDKAKIKHQGKQPAQVAKPWGAVQPFDTGYDAKAAGTYAGPSATPSASGGSSKSYPPGKKMPKGEHTGKPLKKGGAYEINKLPPVDMAAPVEGQALWGTQGQAKLTVDWWNVHHQGNLTPGQKAAATYYSTTSGANAMNFHLRGEVAASAKTRKAIQQLDEAMQPLPTTVQVSRGMGHANFWPDGDLTGETVRDLGYGSTSMTSGFGGQVQMHITIPAGIRAMPLKDLSNHQHENELLLQRGVGYKVTGDFIDNKGIRHVTAVAVPPPDPDPYDPMKG